MYQGYNIGKNRKDHCMTVKPTLDILAGAKNIHEKNAGNSPPRKLVCARTLSAWKVPLKYFPPMFTKLVSTPKKSILPSLESTQNIICAAQNKTNSVQKIDDDGNDDEG